MGAPESSVPPSSLSRNPERPARSIKDVSIDQWVEQPISLGGHVSDVRDMAQFHFLDEHDARRPSEFPRISQRYRAATKAVWYPPSRRKVFAGRPQPIEVHVLDLSVAGALFGAPTNPALEMGAKVKMQFDEVWGVSVIRNIRTSSSPALTFYGVSFFLMSNELEMKVMDLVAAVKSTN